VRAPVGWIVGTLAVAGLAVIEMAAEIAVVLSFLYALHVIFALVKVL
jgi:hypothetical protein